MIPKPTDTFRLLHLSDIHFHMFPKNPFGNFNKRIKGLLRKLFTILPFEPLRLAQELPHLLKTLNLDGACITGDFTLTACVEEFEKAREFVDILKSELNIPIYVLPGNHDCYTKQDFHQKTFYTYFPNPQLKKDGISFNKLTSLWWLVLLDCSYPNGWWTAQGKILPLQLSLLENFLLTLPPSSNVIVANHYPLLPSKTPSHDLLNNKLLQNVLKKYPQVKLYIHGHEHKASFYNCKDLPPNFILNAGSVSDRNNARFNVIDLSAQRCLVFSIQIKHLTRKLHPLSLEVCNTHELFLKN